MKKILTMVALAIGACAMTSCIGDSDKDNTPSPQRVREAMSVMGGTYSGYMLYGKDLNVKPDTLYNMSWTVDSVITVHRFPQAVLATSLTDAADKKLVEVVRALPATELKCGVGFYIIDDNRYTLNTIPSPLNFTAVVNGTTSNCSVLFSTGNTYAMGIFTKATRELAFMMEAHALQVDEHTLSLATFSPMYFKLVSTTKN